MIAASKRDRNYQPSLLLSSLEDQEETGYPDTASSTTPLRFSRSSRTSKRSGGSFSHNDERNSFEKEEEEEDSENEDDDDVDGNERVTSTTPKGYNYLPPIKNTSVKQKRTTRGSNSTDSTDETDGKGSYTFMPAPRNIPATTPEGDENYCFMPKPKSTPVKDNQSEIDGSVEKTKEDHTSPIADENYCFMPKPKNTPVNKDQQSKIDSANTPIKDDGEDDVPNENYCFLPPPKPLSSSSSSSEKKTITPSRMNSHERIVSDRQSIKQRTPITPVKKLCQKNDNDNEGGADRSGDEVDAPNYHFLPPPKPTSPGIKHQQPRTPDSDNNSGYTHLPAKANPQIEQDAESLSFPKSDQLKADKHSNRPSNRYGGNTNITTNNNDKIDENYINFAPIQQMKMIAKNNVKPIAVSPNNDPNNYMNFKY